MKSISRKFLWNWFHGKLLLFLNRYIVLFNKSHESILRSISYGSNSIYVSLAGLNVFHGSHGGLTSLVTSLGLRVTFDLNFRSDRKSAGAKFLISDLQWWESDITINYWSYDLKNFLFIIYHLCYIFFFGLLITTHYVIFRRLYWIHESLQLCISVICNTYFIPAIGFFKDYLQFLNCLLVHFYCNYSNVCDLHICIIWKGVGVEKNKFFFNLKITFKR